MAGKPEYGKKTLEGKIIIIIKKNFKSISWKKWKLVFGISVSRRFIAVAECNDNIIIIDLLRHFGVYIILSDFRSKTFLHRYIISPFKNSNRY